jgi:hypothetical protein
MTKNELIQKAQDAYREPGCDLDRMVRVVDVVLAELLAEPDTGDRLCGRYGKHAGAIPEDNFYGGWNACVRFYRNRLSTLTKQSDAAKEAARDSSTPRITFHVNDVGMTCILLDGKLQAGFGRAEDVRRYLAGLREEVRAADAKART